MCVICCSFQLQCRVYIVIFSYSISCVRVRWGLWKFFHKTGKCYVLNTVGGAASTSKAARSARDVTVLNKVLCFLSLQLKLIWVPDLFDVLNTTQQSFHSTLTLMYPGTCSISNSRASSRLNRSAACCSSRQTGACVQVLLSYRWRFTFHFSRFGKELVGSVFFRVRTSI